jgi:hypothetical protein
MLKNSRQNAVILIAITSFFVLSWAPATNNTAIAQTSKKPKAASTPTKKTQIKSEPVQKKAASSSAKTKDAGKKTEETKSSGKNTSKDKSAKDKTDTNKTSDKDKRTSSKQAESKKSNQKTTDKKADDKKTANSKSKKSDSRDNAGKISKTATTTKKDLAPATKKNTTAAKSTSNNTNAAQSKPKSTARQTSREASEGDAPQIIVTDVSARIRSQAKASAPELSRARLGEILQVAEKTPAWYRVRVPAANGKSSSGWISANSVNDLNSAGRDQLYRQIADRYYKTNGMDFATASELYDFLTRAASDAENSASAEIELKRLLALRAALKTIPSGKSEQAPYSDFLKSQEKSVVYSEPAAEWHVSSNLFWDLHKKHQKSPVADQIAWEGAQNPLPGECEGYVNCYLFYARMTSGEYLSLHPTGRKNLEALTNLTSLLDPIVMSLNGNSPYTGPTDVTDRAEFNNLIAELRTIISRLPLVEKEKPLQQLKKIAEGFR